MAVLMRDNQCETLNELDVVLRRYGSSLEKQVRLYGENKAGRSTVTKHVNIKPEITHQEMLDYYEKNAAEFAVPAKARFELLSVRFDKSPSKNDAWNTLAEMGNAVFFGTPFATVARNHSHDPSAARGGQYDWTTQGSLASKPIDAAIFSLEPGKLSQIIEDNRGYHIVQVLERTDAGQISFLDAQADIKKALASQKLDADYKEYVEMLRTNTRVWTIYDEETAIARQPGQPAAALPR
jgi:peptidyl-prolyl cis-trans isomerase C